LGLLANAQSQAEKTLLKNASKQFEAKEFLAALPSYSQLLSIAPDNKDYNFKYGVCLLASDEDVDRALKHLKYVCAPGNFEDKRAYFYLAKAYHLNYQFASALQAYEEFKNKVDSKTANDFREVDRLITMAENGKALMSDIKDIKVLDKTESTTSDFFRNYDMEDMGGNVIKVPEELLSSVDKKKGHSPLMFFPDGGGEIIFSSYGGGDHLDLYSVERTSDGGFSKPSKLEGVVNSPFDEDYPFLHSDGRTLYFSSKGHNSMGGYDVFKSKRDLSTGVFETPVNLDFAISSPDDDIFYMVDKDKRIANFASDRSSESGRLHVYKVAVSSSMLEMALVQGKLINTTGGNAIAQIKVIDANTDEEVGVYMTDEKGNYLIDLPGAGKYKFFVEAEDSRVLHTGLVDVPSFGKIKAFKQEMVLSEESAQEKLVIKNQFDEEADADVLTLIQEVIKQKAELEVNFDGEPEAEVEIEEEVEIVLTESELVSKAGFREGVTIASIEAMAASQSDAIASKIDEETEERDKAYARSLEWTTLSESLMDRAEELYQETQTATDAEQKESLLVLTALNRAEAEEAAYEAAVAIVLAEEVDRVVKQKAELLSELENRNASLKASITSNDQVTMIQKLEEVKSFEDKAEVQADALEAINKRSVQANREARKVIARVEEIRLAKGNAVNDIKTKETQLEKTKKQKDKDILAAELRSLNAEVVDLEVQLEQASSRLIDSQTKADNAVGAVKLLEQMRVGQMEELTSLSPLAIPTGGLEAANLRLEEVQAKASLIEISKEELKRIMLSRPELLSSLSLDEKHLLEDFSAHDYNASRVAVAEDSLVMINGAVENDPSGDEKNESIPQTDDSSDDSKNKQENTSSLEESDSTLIGEDQSQAIEVDIIQDSATDTGLSVDEIAAITPENQPEEALASEEQDYTELSSQELLSRLQTDFLSALDDIENSDLEENEKAKAAIELNTAAVQLVDQKINGIKSTPDYTSDETKQGNVRALEMLAEELDAEILALADLAEPSIVSNAETESLNEDELVESLSADEGTLDTRNSEDETGENIFKPNIERSVDETVQEIGEGNQSDISTSSSFAAFAYEAIATLEQDVESISNDSEKSEIVKAAARIQSRAKLVEELRNEMIIGNAYSDAEKGELSSMILAQQIAIEKDVQAWQLETGTQLTPAEITLAKNDVDYITKRTLIEASGANQEIDDLDFETSIRVIEKEKELSERGFKIIGDSDLVQLQELAASGANITMDRSYESVYSELDQLTEDKAWIAELISDKRLQLEVTSIHKEMLELPSYGDSDEERVRRQNTLNLNIADRIDREMLWKEEELRVAAKRKDVPAEVSSLIEEAYLLSSRADEIRSVASVNQAPIENAEMLSKATLLDLGALDKLERAQELQKHLSKGRDRTVFEYQEAIVINSGLLMDETESFATRSEVRTGDLAMEEGELLDDTSEITERVVPDSVEKDATELGLTPDTLESLRNMSSDLDETKTYSVDDIESDQNEIEVQEVALEKASTEIESEESSERIVDEIAQLDDLERIEATEATRDYPERVAQLSKEDILPISSFDEVTSIMSESEAEVTYEGDWDISKADPRQLEELQAKGVAIAKHRRYQSELEETVAQYDNERGKRVMRLAEVINERKAEGVTQVSTEEAQQLTTEIQIIDGYKRQASLNLASTETTLSALEEEREIIVQDIEERIALQEPDIEKQEEFEPIAENVPELITTEVQAPEVISDPVLVEPEVVEEPIVNNEVVTPYVAPDYDAFVMPEVLSEDLFRVSNTDANRKRSIPIDIGMPSGTIYQVQVGAFRNPIPEAHFSEFDPIMGTLLDNGITRYKVGLFQDESTAIVARDQIRRLGYSDAFVVRYIDGSRDGVTNGASIAITSSNSSASEANMIDSSGNSSSIDNQNGSSDSASGSENPEPTPVVVPRPFEGYDSDDPAYYEDAVGAAPATQVEAIIGLFYTVQVGVYSKPVTLASIFEISPLNSDLTPSGYIRYTSGIFDDLAVADQWKTKIQERGVSDAFVTAYYNGERITLSEASIILTTKGQEELVRIDDLNSLDTDRQGQAIWELVSTSELFSDNVADQIDFKIRMGPYYERIPDKDVKVILDFENNIEYKKQEDGAITYTTKGRMTYDQAQEWRERFLELGISNANVIAMKEGEEVPVKQALEFLLK
jgi:hypothetical protein